MAKKGFIGTLRICALHNLKLGTLLGSCTFYNLQAWYTSRIYAPALPLRCYSESWCFSKLENSKIPLLGGCSSPLTHGVRNRV